MRAVRLTQVGKPLENADVPVPEIGPTEVLIRVAAAGICHSDAHYRAGISKIDRLPLTLGHEVAGSVEKVGAQVANVALGEFVGSDPEPRGHRLAWGGITLSVISLIFATILYLYRRGHP